MNTVDVVENLEEANTTSGRVNAYKALFNPETDSNVDSSVTTPPETSGSGEESDGGNSINGGESAGSGGDSGSGGESGGGGGGGGGCFITTAGYGVPSWISLIITASP